VDHKKANDRGEEIGVEESTNLVFVLFMSKESVANVVKEKVDLC
jgi:hypothetical protein